MKIVFLVRNLHDVKFVTLLYPYIEHDFELEFLFIPLDFSIKPIIRKNPNFSQDEIQFMDSVLKGKVEDVEESALNKIFDTVTFDKFFKPLIVVINKDILNDYISTFAKKYYSLTIIQMLTKENIQHDNDTSSYQIFPESRDTFVSSTSNYIYSGLKEIKYESLTQIRKYLNCISLIELNFRHLDSIISLTLDQAKENDTISTNNITILGTTTEICNNPYDQRYRTLQKFVTKYCESDKKMILCNMGDNFNNYDWLQESKLTYFGVNRHKRNKKTILFYLDKYHDLKTLIQSKVSKSIPFEEKKRTIIARFSVAGSLTRGNGWYQAYNMSKFIENRGLDDDYCIAYNIFCNYTRFRFCFDYKNSNIIDCGFVTDDSIIKKFFPELIKDRLSIENMCEYMFHICLGGNDWGTSLIWQLLNCNVVFIPYPFDFESIFTLGLIPYKHFIPVSHNLNDLDEKIQIMIQNYELCFRVAKSAQMYISQFLDEDFYELVGERIIKTYVNKSTPLV